jgi:hypothetical protein
MQNDKNKRPKLQLNLFMIFFSNDSRVYIKKANCELFTYIYIYCRKN